MKVAQLLILCAYSCSVFAGTAKISGVVVDDKGVPVAGIIVEAFPADMAWSAGVPKTKTDELGQFEINVVNGLSEDGKPYGERWNIYPFRRAPIIQGSRRFTLRHLALLCVWIYREDHRRPLKCDSNSASKQEPSKGM